MTSSNGKIFRVTGPLCGEFTGHRWIPHTKASDAELWFFFYLRLNKRLSKKSWGWWLNTPSRSLWRNCNVPIHALNPKLVGLSMLIKEAPYRQSIGSKGIKCYTKIGSISTGRPFPQYLKQIHFKTVLCFSMAWCFNHTTEQNLIWLRLLTYINFILVWISSNIQCEMEDKICCQA